MSLLVQKFGGTSLGSIERIEKVAETVIQTRQAGHRVVIVVSAMGHETDRLIALAKNIISSESLTEHGLTAQPHLREYAALISTGEQVSAALLSLCLEKKGYRARSLTGGQAGILTDSQYEKARIIHIDEAPIRQALSENCIPVVTGFQGVDYQGYITTLGRGGSDTTAVALAACLSADECQIYTDVDGVYTADPRIESGARRLNSITAEEMLELSSLGNKVLQVRSVEFAKKYHVPLRVLSSFTAGQGTTIRHETHINQQKHLENPIISGITYSRQEATLTLMSIPDSPENTAYFLQEISQQGIEIDMIVQNVQREQDHAHLTFTIHRDNYTKAMEILNKTISAVSSAIQLIGNNQMAKLSLVGVGMRNHTTVAQQMFQALAKEKINVSLISTSEIKISVMINEEHIERGVRALHSTFGLDVPPKEAL